MVFTDSCQRIMLVLVIYELFCRKLLEMYGGIDNRYFISLVGKMVMVWCVKLCIYICLVWVVLLLTRPRRGWAGDHRLLTLLIMPAVRTVSHQRSGQAPVKSASIESNYILHPGYSDTVHRPTLEHAHNFVLTSNTACHSRYPLVKCENL